jgi:hypothetical protein
MGMYRYIHVVTRNILDYNKTSSKGDTIAHQSLKPHVEKIGSRRKLKYIPNMANGEGQFFESVHAPQASRLHRYGYRH